jgi:hypothetical protein
MSKKVKGFGHFFPVGKLDSEEDSLRTLSTCHQLTLASVTLQLVINFGEVNAAFGAALALFFGVRAMNYNAYNHWHTSDFSICRMHRIAYRRPNLLGTLQIRRCHRNNISDSCHGWRKIADFGGPGLDVRFQIGVGKGARCTRSCARCVTPSHYKQ